MLNIVNTDVQLTVQSTPIVEIERIISIVGIGEFRYKVVCDFTDIPKELHEIALRSLVRLHT